MGIGGSLLELGQFLEECERRRQVERVDFAEDCRPGASGRMAADIELTLSTSRSPGGPPAMSLDGAGVDDDGRLRLSFESVEAVVPERPDGVEVEPADVTFEDGGTATVTLTASSTVSDGDSTAGAAAADGGGRATGADGETNGYDEDTSDRDDAGGSPGAETDVDSVGGRESGSSGERRDGPDEDQEHGTVESRDDRSVPPFSDPELLRDVYESCDTFAEMTDALGMDVTAETVRRYMIDHGIHEPDSYGTTDEEGADATPEDDDPDPASPVVLADGVGLPDDVTVDTLVEVVQRSNTIYEVETQMGIERDEAVEMLQQLDLVDYVTGRLALKAERRVDRELVVERLEQHAEAT